MTTSGKLRARIGMADGGVSAGDIVEVVDMFEGERHWASIASIDPGDGTMLLDVRWSQRGNWLSGSSENVGIRLSRAATDIEVTSNEAEARVGVPVGAARK
jgi:hypothetical protein